MKLAQATYLRPQTQFGSPIPLNGGGRGVWEEVWYVWLGPPPEQEMSNCKCGMVWRVKLVLMVRRE